MSALTILLAMLAAGLLSGGGELVRYLTAPKMADIQKRLLAQQHKLSQESLAMISDKTLAREKELLRRQADLARLGRQERLQHSLMSMLGQQAASSQATLGNIMGMMGQVGAGAPPQTPPLRPGTGLVDMLRMK